MTRCYVATSAMRNVTGFLLFLTAAAFAETRPDRWVVILEDPPLSKVEPAAASKSRAAIASRQASVRAAAESRGAKFIASTSNLLNIVVVSGTAEQADALKAVPGVMDVIKDRPVKRHLNRALDLVNTPQAWSAIGGQGSAGAGTKIGILDTGIDQNHPAFNDPGLTVPSGYPKCRAQDCPWTNNKVIVARSYVDTLASGNGTPEDSRPDDLTPRDRVGHGTAVAMIAAGNTVRGPAATITGIAPKAFLGNYKIFGAPGVNDSTFSSVVVLALDDALNDGMDVVTLSLGLPALWTYRDRGNICNKSGNTACDLWTDAVGNAAGGGLTIVVSGGNDGDLGFYPNLNSINTPGTAPSVITVGATTNSHSFYSTAEAVDPGAPSVLRPMYTLISDGPPVNAPIRARVIDVAKVGDDGTACRPLNNNSLAGAIALIQRGGECGFATKIDNAQKAGAVAAMIYREKGDFVYRIGGVFDTGIPSMLISNAAGNALKEWAAPRANPEVLINPALVEVDEQKFADEIAYFSSQGPAIGDLLIKPEIVAPGTGLYVATQKYDPNGDMYDPSGFTVQQGTSFSVPLVAGAVALVKQRFPRATPGQAKSMVVNTADPSNIIDYDVNNQVVKPARVTAQGAGKLNLANVVRTTVTAEPAVISFGEVRTGALPSVGLRLSNLGTSSATLNLTVSQRDSDSRARVTVSPASITLGANQSAQVTVQMTGSNPNPGSYEGAVVIRGGPVELRVPYLYLVGDNVADNAFQVAGFDWVAEVEDEMELDFKVVDKYGVPVSGRSYSWTPANLIKQADKTTDGLGIGYAVVYVGPTVGEQTYTADLGNGLKVYFDGRARLKPTINSGGVVNAASLSTGQGVAPGSYITIFGNGLSPSTRSSTTPYLPISLAGVSVSFDAPASKLSLPGRIYYVSANQVNVQVPWELQGLNSVLMKVSIDLSQTAVYTVPLASVSPAYFEFTDPGNGRLMAAALDEGFKLVYSANPVQRGKVLQLYVNGLGEVNNQPASGELSPASPLATTKQQPTVTIGGQPAQVIFSGLAPNLVGLYQVNVVVPQSAPTGVQPVTIAIGGSSGKATNTMVQ